MKELQADIDGLAAGRDSHDLRLDRSIVIASGSDAIQTKAIRAQSGLLRRYAPSQ
jgi:hypothetical protein